MNETQTIRIRVSEKNTSIKVRDIPLELLSSDPNQPRKTFNEASIRELANSIQKYGLLQPITVRQDARNRGHYLVVAGERRFRAFKLLEHETISAVVTTGDADEIALIENLQREDLNPFEEAAALIRLKRKHGYTLGELGQSVGKAESTVSNLLKIIDLPRKIRTDLSTSKVVGRSFLIEIARLNDRKLQLSLWEEAKQGTLTVRDLRQMKRKSSNQDTDTASKRILSLGKRFVTELNNLAENGMELDDEGYEELLEIYKRFLTYFDNKEVDRAYPRSEKSP